MRRVSRMSRERPPAARGFFCSSPTMLASLSCHNVKWPALHRGRGSAMSRKRTANLGNDNEAAERRSYRRRLLCRVATEAREGARGRERVISRPLTKTIMLQIFLRGSFLYFLGRCGRWELRPHDFLIRPVLVRGRRRHHAVRHSPGTVQKSMHDTAGTVQKLENESIPTVPKNFGIL